jgi:hypothetical protein
MTKARGLVPLLAILAGCMSSAGGGGTGGTSAGTAGTTGTGSAGTTGHGGTYGTAGTTGSAGTTGTAGTTGGSAGTTGSAGTSGGTAGTSGGTAGTTGDTAGTSGGTAGTSGGTAGTTGSAGRGGTTGSAGTTGTAGRGGASGTVGTGGAGGQLACPSPSTSPVPASSVIQFNDNGGWCWYQDERAVVDTTGNKLVIGTTASGTSRNGQNEVVIYDLAAKTSKRFTLPSTLATSNVDDHNSPALLVRPDGKYYAQWSGHRVDCFTRFSVFDGTSWGAEQKYDWTPQGCPWTGASTDEVTYSNPWYMGSNILTMVRSVDTDPGVLTSTNNGGSLSYVGKLTSSPQVGYVAGYYKYWGNNTDRIDFFGTEAHPRDNDNNLWHGYTSNGKVYNSTGTVIQTSLGDPSATTTNAKDISAFTQVFKTGSTVGGVKLCRAWNYDIVRYADGTIGVLGQGRADTCTSTPSGSDPDKRAIYGRFDGTKWTLTYLVKMGPKLYPAEEDYTGLGALDPDDPHTIYISTVYDPRDDKTMSSKHEIWRGTTCDNGATFTWTPVTSGSTVDNIRPIIPKWDSGHQALLWLKGTYSTAQMYSLAVVGTISTR